PATAVRRTLAGNPAHPARRSGTQRAGRAGGQAADAGRCRPAAGLGPGAARRTGRSAAQPGHPRGRDRPGADPALGGAWRRGTPGPPAHGPARTGLTSRFAHWPGANRLCQHNAPVAPTARPDSEEPIMQEVVIVAATRTAIGSFQGSLAGVPAVELGAAVIRRLLEQTGLDGAQVDEVILGHVLTAGAGQHPARQAAIQAGLPHAVPALTLNKVCGSGLKALHLGAQAIRCGDADVVIAGGQESMSLAPYVMPGARTGLRMGHGKVVDTMIQDGLWDAFNDYHMGITAENLVEKYGLSREEQDAFAAASQ